MTPTLRARHGRFDRQVRRSTPSTRSIVMSQPSTLNTSGVGKPAARTARITATSESETGPERLRRRTRPSPCS